MQELKVIVLGCLQGQSLEVVAAFKEATFLSGGTSGEDALGSKKLSPAQLVAVGMVRREREKSGYSTLDAFWREVEEELHLMNRSTEQVRADAKKG